MKHILPILTAALLGVAAPLFAADPAFTNPVFDGVTFNLVDPYTNEHLQGDGLGSYYTVTFNGSGTFYLVGLRNTHLGDIQSEYLTNTYLGVDENQNPVYGDPTYGITHYGYIDSNGKKQTFDLFDKEGNPSENVVNFTSVAYDGNVVTREGYYLGDFKAGEEIQIYLDGQINGNNVWSATATSQEGIYSSRYGGRTDKSNPEMTIGQLYFGDKWSSQMNFGIVASGQSYTPGTGSGGTFGSPLPGGVQIALIAGLFGLGFWYIRRRKAAVA
ncbi:MAG: hypothetical protein IKC53_10180 [Lentisphaeria bacterium]|nr:hypothetical protein [Lentisphaeria bacterium]